MNNLQQRIEATNFLNVQRLDLLQFIEKELKAMEGQKIELAGGGFAKKWTLKGDYKKTTKQIDGNKVNLSYQTYYDISYKNVRVTHKVCISGGSYDVRPATAFAQYVEETDYIGQVDNQHLTETEYIDRCIEYASEEVANPLNEAVFLEQKKQYKEALKTLNALKDNVPNSLKDFLPRY